MSLSHASTIRSSLPVEEFALLYAIESGRGMHVVYVCRARTHAFD